MHEIPQIEVEMVFLTKAEGGREQPPVLTTPTSYRPHLVVADEEYLGVMFLKAPEFIQAQTPFVATLGLVYHPKIDDSRLSPGAKFTVREGARIVGVGRVTKKLYDPVA